MDATSDPLTLFTRQLRSWDGPGRVVSVALDLRGRGDVAPPWQTVLTEGLAAGGFPPNDDALRTQIEGAVRAAVDEGAKGFFAASDPEGRYWAEVASPVPPRNDIRVGDAPWLFEVERLRYLLAQPVVVATVDLHSAHVVRVAGAGTAGESDVTGDAHATRATAGRNNVEGRSGGGAHAGGHSRNRTAHAIEEHRLAAGREAANAVTEIMKAGDILVVAGIPEARALLLSHLPANVASRAITRAALGPEAEAHAALNLAIDLSTAHQLDEGDAFGRSLLGSSGTVARGLEGVASAATRMQIAEIVLHEDAASCWGTAEDVRQRAGLGHDDALNKALRAAVSGGASTRFCRLAALAGEHQGIAATLRW
ncbi:MAG: hypothetical protein ACKVVT_02685 [Dehalococcoidia bacterium]